MYVSPSLDGMDGCFLVTTACDAFDVIPAMATRLV